jgi:lysozyme family protein
MSQPAASPETSSEDAEIVVEGYSPRFAVAVRKLLKIEGGFVDDPKDRGGTTKYGISLRFLAAEGHFDHDADGRADFDLDLDGDIDWIDIRLLKRGDAVFLYHRCFWEKLQADTFPAPIGEMLFDQGVNGGLTAARKLLQRAINVCAMNPGFRAARPNAKLAVDGVIGEKTRASLAEVLRWNALGMPALTDAYRAAAAERYRAIVRRWPDQKRFLNGWLARAEELGR